jgi:hypothetical protein
MFGRRVLFYIGIGALCVLLVVAAAFLFLSAFKPEDEIRRMLSAMSEVSTVSHRSAFSWTRGQGDGRVTTTVYATGQVDASDSSVADYSTKFRAFRVGRSKDYGDLSGEIRSVDGTTYLTYSPPGPEMDGVDFSKEGTWVSFAAGELPAWGAVIPGLDVPIETDFGSARTDATEVALKSTWTSDGIVRLRSLFSHADVFVVAYDDLTELIAGHATRVMDARFDPDALRSFLLDVVRTRENREPTAEERLSVETSAKELEALKVRLWIGMDDHLLYRVQTAGMVQDDSSLSSSDADTVPFDMIVELSGFNDPFKASGPDQAIAFSTVLRQRLGASSDAGTSNGLSVLLPDDAARLPTEMSDMASDADQDELSDLLEAFYRTNARNPDTDGDGISDGEEVRNGQNPRGDGTLFGFGLDE